MTEKELMQLAFGAGKEEEVDIKALLYKYLRYWYLFVLGVVLCLGLAFIYLRYSTPQYAISSKLLIKDDKKGPDILGGNSLFSDLDIFKTTKNVENEIEVLKSLSLMRRVFTELSLYCTYYLDGTVKDQEIYGKDLPVKVLVNRLDSTAFEKQIVIHVKDHNRFELEEEDEEGNVSLTTHPFGQEIQKPYGTFTVLATTDLAALEGRKRDVMVKFQDINLIADYYSTELLKVETVNKDASVLKISMETSIPERGKDIINKLVEVYNKEDVEDKNLIAASTIEFIDERLKFLTTELTSVERDVEQFKRKNRLTDVSSEATLYLERASDYSKQLGELEIQIDVLKSIEEYLHKPDNQIQLVPSSLSIPDPTLLGLITTFNELQLERQRMLRTLPPDNPLVGNVHDQLLHLRANISENLRNIKEGLIITRDNLEANSAQFASRIKQVPTIERELVEISRQQGIKEGLYLFLLQKREESALSLAASVANSRIIDPAMAGREPVKPKKLMILLLAFFMGVGAPFALIYAKDLLNDKVQEKREVEEATGAPVLGEISHNEGGEALVVKENNRTPVAEMFRLVRSNLQFTTLGRENKVILITSSMSGEGKTFFSINLGASLALSGKKVVILSFDLRKPRLLQELGIESGVGITNYLVTEKMRVEDGLVPVKDQPHLFVMGSGPIPPNPAELMLSSRVGALIGELKEKFDYVLIDSSPVGQVADAFSLKPYIDSSIYIVRYGYTYKNQLSLIEEIYKSKKLRSPMVVLNDAKKENGYGYGYGYGYGSEEGNKRKI
ncbi:GumC family protein [Nafulsella turpanensis]|uniref:GumC family protein n=1 Tax=Nafulsella turpanensis TaxID=1265690 RepID=UPI00037BA708|nr:tyrosine-protein kinase [Nafulsella turpanensis]